MICLSAWMRPFVVYCLVWNSAVQRTTLFWSECPQPAAVADAMITTSPLGATQFTPGDSITYSCPSTHDLVGSMTLTCQMNKAWDNPQPCCVLKGKAENGCLSCEMSSFADLLIGCFLNSDNVLVFEGKVLHRCGVAHYHKLSLFQTHHVLSLLRLVMEASWQLIQVIQWELW